MSDARFEIINLGGLRVLCERSSLVNTLVDPERNEAAGNQH